MECIKLEDRKLELYYGRNIDQAPALLARWQNGEGYIPSEADIRLLGVRNFENAPQIAINYRDSSTLSATKGNTIKVILPYETTQTGVPQLTEAAKFGLSLINPNESLVNYGVNLDVGGRWKKLEGSGVYVMKRDGLVLNQNLTEKQAMEHKLLLIKLGHPFFVDRKFARSKDEVAEIIGRTFELGKSEFGLDTMMGQYFPADVDNKGILNAWCVGRLDHGSVSYARTDLEDGNGRFAFYSVRDANKVNAEGVRRRQSKNSIKDFGRNVKVKARTNRPN
jgi:hypothetical protein